MSERNLTTFGELARTLDELPVVLRGVRRSRGLSLRQAAQQMAFSASTLMRIEEGAGYDVASLRAVLAWLDAPPPIEDQPLPARAYHRKGRR